MAGRRRAVNGRATTEPTRAEKKHRRRVADFAERLGKAHRAQDRVAVAADLIRRAQDDMDPATSELFAAQAVDLARSAIREADPSRAREGSRR